MQAKIALLAKLAFGQDVALDKVPCAGISNLSSADFACAKVGVFPRSLLFSVRRSVAQYGCDLPHDMRGCHLLNLFLPPHSHVDLCVQRRKPMFFVAFANVAPSRSPRAHARAR